MSRTTLAATLVAARRVHRAGRRVGTGPRTRPAYGRRGRARVPGRHQLPHRRGGRSPAALSRLRAEPATRTGARSPVVFMFHGRSGTGHQFLRISGWREQADAVGLVAVFPTGVRYRDLESRPRRDGLEQVRPRGRGRPDRAARRLPAGPRARGPPTTSASPTRWWPTCGAAADRPSPHLRVGLLATAPGSPRAWRSSARLCSPRPRSPVAGCRSRGRRAAAPDVLDPRKRRRPDPRAPGPPPLTELPLDPVAMLAEPTIGRRDAQVAVFELDGSTPASPHSRTPPRSAVPPRAPGRCDALVFRRVATLIAEARRVSSVTTHTEV